MVQSGLVLNFKFSMKGSADLFMKSTTRDVVLSVVDSGTTTDANKESGNSSFASTSQEGSAIKASNKMANEADIKSPQRKSITVTTQNLTPEITRLSPISTPHRPPTIPNEIVRRRTSLARSAFSKTKSRLVEPPYPSNASWVEEDSQVVASNSPVRNSSNRVSPRVGVTTPKTPGIPMTPADVEEEEEDEDIYKSINLLMNRHSGKKLKFFVLLEWVVFMGLLGILVASLTIHQLQSTFLWSIALWKWCVLVIVIICGRLVTEWSIHILVFFVERNFLLKKKVLYFVYGLNRSVQVFLWIVFILLAWILLFSHGVRRLRRAKKILHGITMALAGCLVGAGMWLLKTLLIKTIALSFHVQRFFDRIQESLFHQYVLQTLSGPPLMEMAEMVRESKTSGHLSFERVLKDKGVKKEVIDVEKLQRINQSKVSAWTMKGMISVIRRTKLSTISNSLHSGNDDAWSEQTNKEITSEWEAKAAGEQIFKNVAKPGYKYINEEDLLRFMKMDEVEQIFPLFQGATETGKIKKSALKKWVVDAYLERKSLSHSLNDTKTAVEELNRLASAVVLVAIIIVWNLMMGFLTTKILVFITSQLLLVVFAFGNSVKTVFEAIIFVFIMHPFDVGDRCVIDGVQMVVEEMNILTTIFLRYDNEKIIYPNTVLATKPISNFYRSPEMGDAVEFAIDFSTTVETIAALKARIKAYLESKPQHWRSSHSVQVKDILDLNKIKMGLYVTHTINFQNSAEKNSRRSDLVLELKKIFEELGIKYRLIPQEVHVTYVGSPASTSVAQCC